MQVKRVMDKEKQKENLDFFDIFFGKMEGILWKKTQSCLLVAQWSQCCWIWLPTTSREVKTVQQICTTQGEPSRQGSNVARPWIRPAYSAGQFLCHSNHSSLFIKLVIEECIWFLLFQYLLCCLIHLIIRIKKLPHEHPQLQLSMKKWRSWIKTSAYQEQILKQTNISLIYILDFPSLNWD